MRRFLRPLLAAALLAGLPAATVAQTVADSSLVWVFLEGELAAPTDAPALAPESLERRRRLGLSILPTDYPLRDAAIEALEARGLRVRYRSRWLRAVSGWADPTALRALDAVPGVRQIRTVGRVGRVPVRPEPAPDPSALQLELPDYGRAAAQLEQIGVPRAHDLGLSGAGVRIAILDTGFREEHEALSPLFVVARRDFIQGDPVVANEPGDSPDQDHHGTQVWSVLAASAPGELVGPAHGAAFLLAKTEHVPTEPRADEDRWVAALEWADSLGTDVVNSSLGYLEFDDGFRYPYEALNGDSTVTTRAADEAARRGILVVTSVGNRGPEPRTLTAPADADSALAVGAVDAAGRLAPFSGRGPTADGRLKPDLVARGAGTAMVQPGTMAGYTSGSGTSYAAPLIAGGAALFLEAWPELSGTAAFQALLLSGSVRPPVDSMGYGLPDVAGAILFPQGITPLALPGTGAGGELDRLDPEFAWSVPVLHPAARPVRYVVQISAGAGFGSVLAADTVVDAQRLRFTRPIPSGAGLWWRVLAETAVGVTRASEPVGPIEMPGWVALLTLNDPNGVFVPDPRPVLAWTPLPAAPPLGPLSYDVAVLAAATGRIVWEERGLSDTSAVVDEPLQFNQPFRWRVIARTPSGAADTVLNASTFVIVSGTAPPVTLLYQNFPNPFPRPDRLSTTIWFDLARRSEVRLRVYDLHGRLVRRLTPDARRGCRDLVLEPGAYGRDPASDPECVTTVWDGHDDGGAALPPGVYMIRLETNHDRQTIRTLYRP